MDGKTLLTWTDEDHPYLTGAVGVSAMGLCHCIWDEIRVKEGSIC